MLCSSNIANRRHNISPYRAGCFLHIRRITFPTILSIVIHGILPTIIFLQTLCISIVTPTTRSVTFPTKLFSTIQPNPQAQSPPQKASTMASQSIERIGQAIWIQLSTESWKNEILNALIHQNNRIIKTFLPHLPFQPLQYPRIPLPSYCPQKNPSISRLWSYSSKNNFHKYGSYLNALIPGFAIINVSKWNATNTKTKFPTTFLDILDAKTSPADKGFYCGIKQPDHYSQIQVWLP